MRQRKYALVYNFLELKSKIFGVSWKLKFVKNNACTNNHSVPAPQICHTLRDIKQDSVIEYSFNFRMVCILLHLRLSLAV